MSKTALSMSGASKTCWSKTMWLAVFCMVGLAPSIAIKVAAPRVSLVVEPAPAQSKVEPAFTLNESAKSDRLQLPNARAEPAMVALAAKPARAETPLTSPGTPSTAPETVKNIADRRWQDANASIVPIAPARKHPKIKEAKPSANQSPPSKSAEVWHCRQDAVGGLLRSLDLSPRCNL